jgi:hypothetical protein
MSVRVIDDGRQQRLPGYTRGLCYLDGKVFVGTSLGRRVSKSTGMINNIADPGATAGRGTISRLDAATFALDVTVDVGDFWYEVYDLLPVVGVGQWPVID